MTGDLPTRDDMGALLDHVPPRIPTERPSPYTDQAPYPVKNYEASISAMLVGSL
jgi:hypothetical protein